MKSVDEAQALIVQAAKDLANNGEITISEAAGQDDMVY